MLGYTLTTLLQLVMLNVSKSCCHGKSIISPVTCYQLGHITDGLWLWILISEQCTSLEMLKARSCPLSSASSACQSSCLNPFSGNPPPTSTKSQHVFQVRVLRQLHHRNIVQFYGACLEPGSMFFVTELMKGGDLYSALRFHPETMRWDRLGRKVALDVALGINYLHTR